MINIDSLKELDSEKVREIWKDMAEVKEKEREYYNSLAVMVDDLTPNDIYATVQATPRTGTTLPQCAEDLLEELGSEELFQRVLAVGYMAWQKFEANCTKKYLNPYEPSKVREVAIKVWGIHFKNNGPPEGRGHNMGANKAEQDAEGRKEGRGRREEKKVKVKVQDPHSQDHHATSQHFPAVAPHTLSPFGTTDSRSFQDHHDFPRETP